MKSPRRWKRPEDFTLQEGVFYNLLQKVEGGLARELPHNYSWYPGDAQFHSGEQAVEMVEVLGFVEADGTSPAEDFTFLQAPELSPKTREEPPQPLSMSTKIFFTMLCCCTFSCAYLGVAFIHSQSIKIAQTSQELKETTRSLDECRRETTFGRWVARTICEDKNPVAACTRAGYLEP